MALLCSPPLVRASALGCGPNQVQSPVFGFDRGQKVHGDFAAATEDAASNFWCRLGQRKTPSSHGRRTQGLVCRGGVEYAGANDQDGRLPPRRKGLIVLIRLIDACAPRVYLYVSLYMSPTVDKTAKDLTIKIPQVIPICDRQTSKSHRQGII